ncbi:hypothetical protein BT63DRAFT_199948 [Microthyrium microscopicum]|uniref:Uncharacterized protein n=1 Tax=Microthyrium microscopicum TaxID=703497 RepID=A0A6A6UEL3_9PEZI|nr:hypothetical protein BT63DRAFT_199948 [Microthyrium microscopicum]
MPIVGDSRSQVLQFVYKYSRKLVLLISTNTSPYTATNMDSIGNVCFVCRRMRETPKHADLKTVGELHHCLLCRRDYCDTHKSSDKDNICEINHITYYGRHPHLHDIWPSLERRSEAMDAKAEVSFNILAHRSNFNSSTKDTERVV